MHKKQTPEMEWVARQILTSPVLRNSPSSLGPAFVAHIGWVSDFGGRSLYRAHNNLSGIPYGKELEKFRATQGLPDNEGRICRFASLEDFVDCYLYLHGHLLSLSAEKFFEHMKKNDLSANADRRWGKIREVWERTPC